MVDTTDATHTIARKPARPAAARRGTAGLLALAFALLLTALSAAPAAAPALAAEPAGAGQTADRAVRPDTWVFTDGLGRRSLTHEDVGNPREDRTVAMFYWTWHAELAPGGALNTTELMRECPEAKNDYAHWAWRGKGNYCFWNEPIYGFYRTDDPWVLRRQAELLADAGVDTIFADNTNGDMTWRRGYTKLYETWDQAQRDGVPVPAVSYLLPFSANAAHDAQVRSLYEDIYKPGKYRNLWFFWEDKPMLAAFNSNFKGEIRDFFTWRGGQPGYAVQSTLPKQWGWLSIYPQALYSKRGESGVKRGQLEEMSVGVAQNHNYVTHEITAMNGEHVMGRSYTSAYPDRYEKEGPSSSLYGYNFAEQFEYALEKDPQVVFITGWNEWHAWRQPGEWGGPHSLVRNALADEFDDEFSRDLEPTKGALKDHYYYQLVNFVRRYKGCAPIPVPSGIRTIDLSSGGDQWEGAEPYFAAYAGNTGDRDAAGYGKLRYAETSGRNDIVGAQVARDDDHLWFRVECAEDITADRDPLWMNLYLDCDGSHEGWNTFDYVVRPSGTSDASLSLERFTDGFAAERVAECPFRLDGRFLTVQIAKSDLGLEGHDYTVNFAWTDNVHDEGTEGAFSGDIMDFYISGDVAPGGRFKYSYVSTRLNATGEGEATEAPTGVPTEAPTEAPTAAPTEAPTASPTEAPTASSGGSGCASAAGSVLAALSVCLPASLALSRRRRRTRAR